MISTKIIWAGLYVFEEREENFSVFFCLLISVLGLCIYIVFDAPIFMD